jgi:FkbM family methyltransferase
MTAIIFLNDKTLTGPLSKSGLKMPFLTFREAPAKPWQPMPNWLQIKTLNEIIMFTRAIFPLSLRQRVSSHVQKLYPDLRGDNVSLEFDKTLKLDLSKADVAHRSIIFNGFYELSLSKQIARLGREGGVLVDVGANYGYFSCLWASKNPVNKVFAFEASPLNIGPLRNNIRKNSLESKVRVIPTALGNKKGTLKFSLGNEQQQTGWGGFTMDPGSGSANTVEVEVDTLDNYAADNRIDHIDVLKIDTEGADTWVLYGARDLLRNKRIKNIFYECNIPRMKLLNISESESRVFLEELDYVVVRQSPSEFYAYPK